jgi:glutamate synthase (NADPH/NADH) small chain
MSMYQPDTKLFVPVQDPRMTADKTAMPEQPLQTRIQNFDEVALGYTEEQAKEEASRCLKCPGHYCQQSCPAHVPVPEFIAAVRNGDFEGAYQLISTANHFPAITGRVCAQECQCECDCTRGIKGQPTAIGRLERFVADWHSAHENTGLTIGASTGKQVAVIGSGPAGISCACDLAASGHSVTVFEGRSFLGGVPVYGIPEFVLPNSVVQEKIDQIKNAGVKLLVNHLVKNPVDLLQEGFDAVFAATGAGKSVALNVPGEQLDGVCTANDYLTRVNVTCDAPGAKQVAVIGGGNTAIDVCRAAMRMGAESVVLLYRREESQMPARKEEIAHAKDEGVALMTLTSPVTLNGTECVSSVTCVRNQAGEPAYPSGRPESIAIPNSEFEIPADLVVLALGYTAEPFPGLSSDGKGRLQVAKNSLATGVKGVFAGGDAVNGAATLVAAMTAGKQAAKEIDQYLQ